MKNIFEVDNLSVRIDNRPILKNINVSIPEKSIFAIIGPSGSGKSTLLKVLNRIIEIYDGVEIEGDVKYKGSSIFDIDPVNLRREVGIIFQQPNPFPHMSIYENIAYPLKCHGVKDKELISKIVESVLRKVGLWDEVKYKLNVSASKLSGGQQQRLCIARALALGPKVLLMDEPTSMIDIVNSRRIENLMEELRKEITIVLVSHSLQQVLRVSDYVAVILNGEIKEWGETKEVLERPKTEIVKNYLNLL